MPSASVSEGMAEHTLLQQKTYQPRVLVHEGSRLHAERIRLGGDGRFARLDGIHSLCLERQTNRYLYRIQCFKQDAAKS
eukprot:3783030-Amphidinium_carterae.1